MAVRLFILFQIFLLFISLSCNYKFKITVDPQDTSIFINGEKIFNNDIYISKNNEIKVECKRRGYKDFEKIFGKKNPFGVEKIDIKMDKEEYSIIIDTINNKSELYYDSKKLGTTPCRIKLKYGAYSMILKRNGFADQVIRVEARRDGNYFYCHKKDYILLPQIGVFQCGSLPKQIIYSPEDDYIFIPVLGGDGFQIFNNDTLKIDDYIVAPDKTKSSGFPEGLFIKEKNVFLISQMTTGKIYEYSYPQVKYKRTISTGGIWSKFMVWCDELQVVAVSNWSTNDVSIINYESGEVIKKIDTAPAPRGLIFSKDGKYLFITSFEGGKIYKVKTDNWKIEKVIDKKNAAMRHIILSDDNKKAYVSNMYHNEVYEIDVDDFTIINTYKVDYNPNTIAMTPDNKFIYVSCRGPNAPETYLERSPRNGFITIIDIENKKIAGYIEGGNQPTGLDISKDGNYLAFSNFRDNNFEIYWLGNND